MKTLVTWLAILASVLNVSASRSAFAAVPTRFEQFESSFISKEEATKPSEAEEAMKKAVMIQSAIMLIRATIGPFPGGGRPVPIPIPDVVEGVPMDDIILGGPGPGEEIEGIPMEEIILGGSGQNQGDVAQK